ncbi:hypothetical protein Tco_1533284 [Tanacetum coccineum]
MNVEEISSKAMVAIDGAGFDWSFMAEEEVTTNMALMAFSDSEVYNDKTCSNTRLKSFETLKTQLDNLRVEFNKFEFNPATYKRRQLNGSQISGNSRKGVGYNAVPPPPTGYGPKASKSVYVDISNEVKKTPDTPLGIPPTDDQGYVDSGCSRHMTGNISYLSDLQEIVDKTRAQQKALDDELEPTLQVVLDALKLTLFYKAFEITTDVPEIYMQEFWVTVSRHHSLFRFKLNGKSHTVNVDNFRDMLKICPKLPSQIFEEPPLKEEVLSFIRDLGHTDEIKFLSDVNVKWRTRILRRRMICIIHVSPKSL